MLTPEQLKPFLLHEDKYVCRAVVEYFADSWSRDPDLLPMVLAAWERHGASTFYRELRDCDQFVVTAAGLDAVLGLLARTEDEQAIAYLNRVVAAAPLDLLTAREAALLEDPHFDRELVPKLERRRELAGWSGAKLWEGLQDYSRRSDDKDFVGEIDHDYADALVEALTPHEVPDAETVCRLLQAPEINDTWLETFLIDLAGARRTHQAVPALVDKFQIDADDLLERCKVALAKIGDPEACRLLRAAYPSASDDCKLMTSDVPGTIKHPESEDTIFSLLEMEKDPTHRTILCLALCQLFSERGVPVVLQQVESGYDRSFTRLEDDLLPVAAVLGVTLPEAERWTRERAENEQRIAARIAEMAEWSKKAEALRAQGIDPYAQLRAPSATRAKPKPIPPPVLPVKSVERKIGRNDPCPCGSGKKFKKCCGRMG